MASSLQNHLSERFDFSGVDSVEISVLKKGKVVGRASFGKNYKYFDLASLTKIMFAAPAGAMAVSQGDIQYKDRVDKYLSWWPHDTKVSELLTHTSGLNWWQPLYKMIDQDLDLAGRQTQIASILRGQKIIDRGQSQYSDLGILLFGLLLQKVYSAPLNQIYRSLMEQFSHQSFFGGRHHPCVKASEFAPTEKCKFRNRIVRGDVHDENTYALGGVSLHAGLFGTLGDCELYVKDMYRHLRSRTTFSKTLHLATERQIPAKKGDWGYGFMKPTKGAASCGQNMKLTAFGHTGFTGTSIWMQDRAELGVVILSNRVHPTRENRKFVRLRPQIHDAILDWLEE